MSKTHVYLSKEAAAIVEFKDAQLASLRAELAAANLAHGDALYNLECEKKMSATKDARNAELEGALNEIANLDGLGLGDVLDIACNALRYKERAQP